MTHESPIEPTVGRIVLVRGPAIIPGDAAREIPAIVTRVWSRNCINVFAFRDEADGGTAGGAVGLTSLLFDGSDDAVRHAAWRWMPYQEAQAASKEAQ